MGLLVNGQWQDIWYETDKSNGHFERESVQLRNWVTKKDGALRPSGEGGFTAVKWSLLPVCVACLSMGAPNRDFSGMIFWVLFLATLDYKCRWNGKNFIRIGRFQLSSKLCSCCGADRL